VDCLHAADLDENYGGLGVNDDDVDMVANPLVIEMQDLEKQIANVNSELGTNAEVQAREIDELELERQRLHAEIARVKNLLASQQAQAKTGPARVSDRLAGSPGLGNYRLPVSPSPRSKFGLNPGTPKGNMAVKGGHHLMAGGETRSDEYSGETGESGETHLSPPVAGVPRNAAQGTRHDFEPTRTVRKKKGNF